MADLRGIVKEAITQEDITLLSISVLDSYELSEWYRRYSGKNIPCFPKDLKVQGQWYDSYVFLRFYEDEDAGFALAIDNFNARDVLWSFE